MLHHLSIAVVDLQRSKAFYDAVLAPLGYTCVWEDEVAIGYGAPGGGDKFSVKLRPEKGNTPGDGFHIAFAAPTRSAVDLFWDHAMRHGGQDNGGAGLHPEYGTSYYAAYVFDPDGYRIEAVINRES